LLREGKPQMSRASAMAAARLRRSEQRLASEQMMAPEEPAAVDDEPAVDARAVFKEAYAACRDGNAEKALTLLESVGKNDQGVAFEAKALPSQLLLSSEGSQGFTMLHQAAWHGSELGVRSLLRMGANAAQRNAAAGRAERCRRCCGAGS
jgi:hypothetical protein